MNACRTSSRPVRRFSAKTLSIVSVFTLTLLAAFLFAGRPGGPPAPSLCMAGTETADPKSPESGKAADVKPSGDSVTVYVTSWCPACSMTINYLKQKQIPFTVKDIEKNKDYMDEMVKKVGGYRGVPVLEINGKTYLGFNPSLVDDLGKK
jgi:glutaredoxin 3